MNPDQSSDNLSEMAVTLTRIMLEELEKGKRDFRAIFNDSLNRLQNKVQEHVMKDLNNNHGHLTPDHQPANVFIEHNGKSLYFDFIDQGKLYFRDEHGTRFQIEMDELSLSPRTCDMLGSIRFLYQMSEEDVKETFREALQFAREQKIPLEKAYGEIIKNHMKNQMEKDPDQNLAAISLDKLNEIKANIHQERRNIEEEFQSLYKSQEFIQKLKEFIQEQEKQIQKKEKKLLVSKQKADHLWDRTIKLENMILKNRVSELHTDRSNTKNIEDLSGIDKKSNQRDPNDVKGFRKQEKHQELFNEIN